MNTTFSNVANQVLMYARKCCTISETSFGKMDPYLKPSLFQWLQESCLGSTGLASSISRTHHRNSSLALGFHLPESLDWSSVSTQMRSLFLVDPDPVLFRESQLCAAKGTLASDLMRPPLEGEEWPETRAGLRVAAAHN